MIRGLLKNFIRSIERAHKNKAPLAQAPAIDDKKFLFIGGLHRSGTSILHRLLREHPKTTGFHNTGALEDEGQHLQSLFTPAYKHGKPGGFAFDLRSHLTEDSVLNTVDGRDMLLREWGAYYDLDKELFLEKSPPNLVRSRFFQSLFPNARFIFIVRHPISVALATRKWTDASITELMLHWHVAYSIMLMDLRYIKNYAVIRYEDLVESPQACLDDICRLLEVEGFSPSEKVMNHNAKYFSIWEQEFAKDREVIEKLFPYKRSPLEIFGYSLSEPYVGSYQGL